MDKMGERLAIVIAVENYSDSRASDKDRLKQSRLDDMQRFSKADLELQEA
jgi:hypothetical protein